MVDGLVDEQPEDIDTEEDISGRIDVGPAWNLAPVEAAREDAADYGATATAKANTPQIRQWQAGARLTKIHLVGPADNEFSKRAEELVQSDLLVRHGTLPPTQVSELLRKVGFALTNVSEETWSKSTAFMAAAAHECPVVIASARAKSVPLCYAIGAEEVADISDTELTTRGAALAQWYREHADWPIIATRMAALLESGR